MTRIVRIVIFILNFFDEDGCSCTFGHDGVSYDDSDEDIDSDMDKHLLLVDSVHSEDSVAGPETFLWIFFHIIFSYFLLVKSHPVCHILKCHLVIFSSCQT